MANQFLCNCGDTLAAGDLSLVFNGGAISGSGISIATGRTGNGISVASFTNGELRFLRGVNSNQQTIIVGLAVKLGSLQSSPTFADVIQLLDGSSIQVSLAVSTTGQLQINRSGATGTQLALSAAGVIVAGVWYYIEFKVTIAGGTSGSASARVNGTTVLSVSGVNTQATSNAYAGNVGIGLYNAGAGVYTSAAIVLDDIYINDGTGAANNDFAGDCKVAPLQATSAGHDTAWTANTGTTTAAISNTTQDGDTTYIKDSTPGDISTFVVGSLPSGVSSVRAVQITTWARKDDAGNRQIAPVLSDGTTDAVGTAVGLNQTYAPCVQQYDTNPLTSSAWATGDFATLQAGVKLVS